MAGSNDVDPVSVVPESVVLVSGASIGDRDGAVGPATSGLDGNQVDVPVQHAVDVVCDGVTASFAIHYVSGAEAERIAAAQAKALAALLRWQAGRSEVG
ncbi:hypothetical protein [Nocardia sp. NPDC051750]|uniref:hypothetical protein n=1 Tax=Nocardia sp. NPDC051750 TaxID=3364325 RepID=UPI00378B9223